jgi:2-oxoglutarate dehydrogenase E1 component
MLKKLLTFNKPNPQKMLNFVNKFNFSSNLTNDSFNSGTNANYIEHMYSAWLNDPKSVHISWNAYFSNLEKGIDPASAFQAPPTLDQSFSEVKFNKQVSNVSRGTPDSIPNIQDAMKVILLIRSYQRNGYLKADIDPLRAEDIETKMKSNKIFQKIKSLDHKYHGLTDNDLEREFVIKSEGMQGILSENKPTKLKDIIERCEKAYCSTIGVEYMYINSREECNFLRDKFENEWVNYKASNEKKIDIYDRLAWSVKFEEFLKNKFTTLKRFGLEGLESLISGLKNFVDTSVEQGGLKDITLGMAHRGRLNVLANVFRKPINKIFAEFQGKHSESEYQISGDVKYHLGSHYERNYSNGRTIKMDILPNPSHLETVDPIVLGMTRAKQHFHGDVKRNEHRSILIHGDAAFAGQGIVYESIQMSDLESFTTGGVLHIVANNQIGFTTSAKDGKSTPFTTDIGKAVEAPIIHVNADDPIAVDFVFQVAAEYLYKFSHDIIIDVYGYRRMGHNEQDQPYFTQPLMYKKIAQHPGVLKIYEDRIIKEGVPEEECAKIKTKINNLLEKYYQDAIANKIDSNDWIPYRWENFMVKKFSAPQDTGIPIQKIKTLGEKINTIPDNFNAHPVIKKIYEQRLQSIKEGKGIDWATAEALAWGHLIEEGYTVRLTGQDVERGTFSHRHAVLHDQNNDSKYIPLNTIKSNTKNFQVYNSLLSEYGVLGFELGFSYYSPDSLVMWEAQFGDFANGAQIIIDNYLSSAEQKWNVQSGLVLLLPHGMDGQGAEHSSCRIERFLQLMDDDAENIPDLNTDRLYQIQSANMQVCNPTSPANYFHLLIRQLKRQFRKPLIIPSPKKLLKFKQANSNIEEFNVGIRYTKLREEYHPEVLKNVDKVKKILVCSGQVYYDLINRREKLQRNVFTNLNI